MKQKRPRILVSGPDRKGKLSWQCLRAAVFLAGGTAVRTTPSSCRKHEDFDGLILSGGSDIHPGMYEEKSLIESRYDEARDRMEADLIASAFSENKPILGICRGMQMLNVYFGGTLHQELGSIFDDFLPPTSTLGKIVARHTVELKDNSKLAEIFRASSCRVNSLHHQGVNKLAGEFQITARLKSGIAQGIERTGSRWILGVQWHPEFMLHVKEQRRLFHAFILACQADASVLFNKSS